MKEFLELSDSILGKNETEEILKDTELIDSNGKFDEASNEEELGLSNTQIDEWNQIFGEISEANLSIVKPITKPTVKNKKVKKRAS